MPSLFKIDMHMIAKTSTMPHTASPSLSNLSGVPKDIILLPNINHKEIKHNCKH